MTFDDLEELIRKYLSTGIAAVVIIFAPGTGDPVQQSPSVSTVEPADPSAGGERVPLPDDDLTGASGTDPGREDPPLPDAGPPPSGPALPEPRSPDPDPADARPAQPRSTEDPSADEPSEGAAAGSPDPGETGYGSDAGSGGSGSGGHDTGESDTGESETDDLGTGDTETGDSDSGGSVSGGSDSSGSGAGGPNAGSGSEPPAATAPAPNTAPGPGAAPADGAPGTGASTGDTATAADRYGWGTPDRVDDFTGGTEGWNLYEGPGYAGKGNRSASALSITDGVLTITGDSAGTTAGMSWGQGQKYGRWEGRVRAPASDPSYNALLLLWPDAEDFPAGGEIDFMEMTDPTRQETNLYVHHGADNSQVNGKVQVDATQWHNWAVEWTPDGITAYLDGEEWYRNTDTSILPPGPMHLCIQLDWFPQGDNPTESTMHVDWVKQYSLDETATAEPGGSGTGTSGTGRGGTGSGSGTGSTGSGTSGSDGGADDDEGDETGADTDSDPVRDVVRRMFSWG